MEDDSSDVLSDTEVSDVLGDLGQICADPPKKREVCGRCRRPNTVCWCPFLPTEPIDIATDVYILQHPFEESRPLQTAHMLRLGLMDGKCTIHRGKRFPQCRFPGLSDMLAQPNTLLMFPGANAIDLETYLRQQDTSGEHSTYPHYNLVLLDGTWSQAKGLYCQNPMLHDCTQVQLSNCGLSEYTVRTQPNDCSLSTLETAAIALSLLEDRPDIKEALVGPLRALCKFQLEYGASTHRSKQSQIDDGLYVKQKRKTKGS